MRLKKGIAGLLAVSAIMAAGAMTSYAGQWQTDARGWVYQNDDGSYAINQWVYDKGVYYFMGTDGVMKANDWVNNNGRWFYLDESGAMVYGGARNINGVWYSFNPDGSMQTGWVQRDGKWYYYASSGAMQTGWVKVDDKWYFLGGSDGSMSTGWLDYNGNRYYLYSDGHMATGIQTVDGKKLMFMQDGRFVEDADSNQGQMTDTDVTRMNLFNSASDDLGWDEIESLAEKYYTNLYSTSNEILQVINGWRNTNRVPELKLSSSLTKSAFALAISNKSYEYYGADDEDTTGVVEYAQAATMFNANVRGLTMAKEEDLNKAVQSLYNKQQLQVLCQNTFTAAGIGFIRLDDGQYELVIMLY